MGRTNIEWKPILARASETDIAWAAGLFEGDGWFTIKERRRDNVYITMGVAMRDQDVVEKFASIVGGHAHYDIKYKVWYCRFSTLAQIEAIVELFWEYLGERRRARARELAIEPPGV